LNTAAPRLRQKPALLIEALFVLIMATLLIQVLPFRQVAKLAAGRVIKNLPQVSTEDARLISNAVLAWSRYIPWRTVCFQQGLAVLIMLRRRKYSASLFYGARHQPDAKLVAHVWVQSGDIDVIGCETAKDFALLAAFPEYGLANP
jgi:Transglutaminase-like superfamily